MASYVPITEKEETETLLIADKIVVIQNGQVRLLSAEDLVTAIHMAQALDSANTSIGTTQISHIGDGTITGAIQELFDMVYNMPKVTSGSAEPSGGTDGDIYVMHEE